MKSLLLNLPSFSVILTFISLLIFGILPIHSHAQDGDVVIHIDSTEQVVQGFGGAFIHFWRPDMTDAEIETAFGNDEGELGFTILRLGIDPNPARWSENLHTAKKAYDLGAKVFASPWNAPDYMLKPGVENDTVAYEYYDEYAAHLDSFNTYMSENGVELHAISVQNEPDYAKDWTGWSTEGMLKFMRENAPDIGTKVMAPESFQFRRGISDALLNDSLANANLDIIGGHIYGGGLAPYPLAEEKGKEVWMTEHYTTSDRSGNIWPDALEVATEIQQSLKYNWNAYIWWYLVRYYGPIHDGVDAPSDNFTDRAQKGSITKRGYVMAQFSKFILPGYQRIYVDEPFGRGLLRTSATAYIDSNQSNLVIVAINDENDEKEFNYIVRGAEVQTFNQYRTDSDLSLEALDDIEVTDNQFTTTLPAKSITTFVSSGITVSNEQETLTAPEGFQLHQNYPNPFNPSTVISYQLPMNSEVSLKVFDMLGREVATLVDERKAAGEHEVHFDASPLSSGMYIYRIQAGDFLQTRKMILIK